MIHENENPDNEQKFNLTDKFTEDIKNLYSASVSVPPEVDRAILNKASQKLTRPRSNIRIWRWIGPVAAAATIIIFISLPKVQKQKTNIAPMETLASVSTDFDNSGRVDILDAFKLAKLIQSEKSVDNKWDINGDGQVDSDDVDKIALVAVSLD